MGDADAIHALRESFVEAFNRQDIEAMAQHLADDNVGMPPRQPPIEGVEANKASWAEGFRHGRSVFTVIPIEVEVAGDIAFDRFEWEIETTPSDGGESMRDKGNCVWINRRQADGSWKVARAIWNSTRPEAGPWA